MVEMTNKISAYQAYDMQAQNGSAVSKDKKTESTKEKSAIKPEKTADYGKTIGKPELSERAKKYYDQLKLQFGNYDFILVSKDQKENAKANAAKYANGQKTVVLIDEEKIEKMATDANYRKKYEAILSGASAQLSQLKDGIAKTGADVKGFGMQVNDNGTTSFFAVLKDSSNAQKARIEKKAAEKKVAEKAAHKKADAKKAKEKKEKQIEKEKAQEKQKTANEQNKVEENDDTAYNQSKKIISSDSVEDLLSQLEAYAFDKRSNEVQTEAEKLVGQSIDFRG